MILESNENGRNPLEAIFRQRCSRIYQHRLTPPKKKILDYYDRLTSVYSDLYGEEQSAKFQTALELLKRRHFGIAIDLGCGDGKLHERLQRISDWTVGLELSMEMIRLLRKSSARDVVRGDIFHSPFRDGIANCVTSISVADQHSFRNLLGEAVRIGSKDSVVLVSVIHPSELAPVVSSKVSGDKRVEIKDLSGRETLYLFSAKPVLKNE